MALSGLPLYVNVWVRNAMSNRQISHQILLDLAIISTDVNGDNLIACLQLLTRAIPRHIDIDIEPLAFSTHEYDSAIPVEMLGDIKCRGKVIYDN